MIEVLVSYPAWGSLWLTNCKWVENKYGFFVVGEWYNDGWNGSSFNEIPGSHVLNFPGTCVRKVRVVK